MNTKLSIDTSDRVSSLLIAALLLVTTLAAAVWRLSDVGPGFPGSESYSRIAQNLLHTGQFGTSFRPPVYPLFLAGMMALFGEYWEYGAVFIQAILSATLGFLLYRTTELLAESRTAGFFAVGLYLTNILFQFETTAKRETTIFTLLLVLFFWGALFIKRFPQKYLLMSLTAALALLLRPNAVALLPVGALVLLFDCRTTSFSIRSLLAPIILFLALIIPWQLFVLETTGTFPLTTSTNSGQTLWKGNNAHLFAVWPKADVDLLESEMSVGIGNVDITTAEGDRLLKAQAIEFIKADPLRAIRLGVAKALLFFSPVPIPMGDGELVFENGTPHFKEFRYRNLFVLVFSTIHSAILVVGFVGFLASVRRATDLRQRAAFIVGTFTLLLLLIHSLTYPESRYRWPLDILWTILAADYFSRLLARSDRPSTAP